MINSKEMLNKPVGAVVEEKSVQCELLKEKKDIWFVRLMKKIWKRLTRMMKRRGKGTNSVSNADIAAAIVVELGGTIPTMAQPQHSFSAPPPPPPMPIASSGNFLAHIPGLKTQVVVGQGKIDLMKEIRNFKTLKKTTGNSQGPAERVRKSTLVQLLEKRRLMIKQVSDISVVQVQEVQEW